MDDELMRNMPADVPGGKIRATVDGRTVYVLFENEYDVLQAGELGFESSSPRVICVAAEVPGVKQNDVVVVDGRTFRVKEVKPDSWGVVTLELKITN